MHAETRPCSVIVCGRWGRDVLAGTDLPVRQIFSDLSDTPTMAEALEIAETLMRKRESDTGTKADIHEQDEAYLRACRENAKKVAERCSWQRIGCSKDGAMRTVEDIHEEIYRRVTELLKA